MAEVPEEKEQSSTKNPPQDVPSKSLKDFISTLPARQGWAEHLFLYKDYWFKPQWLENILAAQDTFKPRDDDIILATQPKCGTTWLKALVFTTVNRSRYRFSDHPLLTQHPQHVVPFIEIPLQGKDCTHIETIPSPRLLATHMPLCLIPVDTTSHGCRIVYLCRDPKDVFVSRLHFENKIAKDCSVELDDAFNMFCEGFSPYGPIWTHCLEYWNSSIARPNKVMFLKYEDIKAEPEKIVRKLAEFLGVPFTEEEENNGIPEEVVSLCSFETLAGLRINQSRGVCPGSTASSVDLSMFFRKGQVGDWANHISDEMGARLDGIVQKKLQGTGLTF